VVFNLKRSKKQSQIPICKCLFPFNHIQNKHTYGKIMKSKNQRSHSWGGDITNSISQSFPGRQNQKERGRKGRKKGGREEEGGDLLEELAHLIMEAEL
jgi:hypothetical protein